MLGAQLIEDGREWRPADEVVSAEVSSWGSGRDELAIVDELVARLLVSHQRHESGDRLPAVGDEDDLSSLRFGHPFAGALP